MTFLFQGIMLQKSLGELNKVVHYVILEIFRHFCPYLTFCSLIKKVLCYWFVDFWKLCNVIFCLFWILIIAKVKTMPIATIWSSLYPLVWIWSLSSNNKLHPIKIMFVSWRSRKILYLIDILIYYYINFNFFNINHKHPNIKIRKYIS